MNDFSKRLKRFMVEECCIWDLLETYGSEAVEEACGKMSLRELGRRTGLSPTYLSHVRNGKQSISPRAYLLVVAEVKKQMG